MARERGQHSKKHGERRIVFHRKIGKSQSFKAGDA